MISGLVKLNWPLNDSTLSMGTTPQLKAAAAITNSKWIDPVGRPKQLILTNCSKNVAKCDILIYLFQNMIMAILRSGGNREWPIQFIKDSNRRFLGDWGVR